MPKLFYSSVVVEIDAPIEKVKPIVFSLKKCELWNPGVERVDLLQEEDGGVGNNRVCNFYGGSFVHERVTAETDTTTALVITTNKPKIMSTVGPEFVVEKIDEKKTKLTSKIVYRPALMPLTYCLAAGPMKKQTAIAAWHHAQGIKLHCETGEVVTDKTELPPPPTDFGFEYK